MTIYMSILWLVAINLNFTRLWVLLYLPGVPLDRIRIYLPDPEFCHKPHPLGDVFTLALSTVSDIQSLYDPHATRMPGIGDTVAHGSNTALRGWWRRTQEVGARILSLLRVDMERSVNYAGRGELPTHLFHAFLFHNVFTRWYIHGHTLQGVGYAVIIQARAAQLCCRGVFDGTGRRRSKPLFLEVTKMGPVAEF
ncbi:hypothetical protein B0H13DRAFT_2515863 [Mycena leptocephala]|nr:hypothetical protein B0H13DRAFT_2515863 [Mycena leptocephala]